MINVKENIVYILKCYSYADVESYVFNINICSRGTSIIPSILIYTYIATVLGPCKDGYYGSKCRLRCPFPYFGEGCVLKCNCSEEHCQHVHGCQSPQGSQGIIMKTFTKKSKASTK